MKVLEIAFVSLNWATSASLSILMPKRHLHLTTRFMIHFCVLFLFSFSLKMFRIKKLCRMCVLHTISTLRNCYMELEGVFTSSNKLSYFTMIQSSDTRNRPRNGRKKTNDRRVHKYVILIEKVIIFHHLKSMVWCTINVIETTMTKDG